MSISKVKVAEDLAIATLICFAVAMPGVNLLKYVRSGKGLLLRKYNW